MFWTLAVAFGADIPPADAPDAPSRLQRTLQYKSERLYTGVEREGTLQLLGAVPVVGRRLRWGVYRDARPLGAREFADRIGDGDMVARLRRSGTRAAVGGTVGVVASVAAFAGGVALATDENVANDVAGAVLALGVGVTGAMISVALPTMTWTRRRGVAGVYPPDDVAAHIRAYNEALRVRLALTEEDVRPVEMAP